MNEAELRDQFEIQLRARRFKLTDGLKKDIKDATRLFMHNAYSWFKSQGQLKERFYVNTRAKEFVSSLFPMGMEGQQHIAAYVPLFVDEWIKEFHPEAMPRYQDGEKPNVQDFLAEVVRF